MGGRRGTEVPLVSVLFQIAFSMPPGCRSGAKGTVLRESDDQKEPVGAARVTGTQ